MRLGSALLRGHRFGFAGGELGAAHAGVKATLGQQLAVRAPLDDAGGLHRRF